MGQYQNSFKTLHGYWLLPKDINIDLNWLTGYKETKIWKISRIEHLFATSVGKISIIKHTMEHLSPQQQKSKLNNSTHGSILCFSEISTQVCLADRFQGYIRINCTLAVSVTSTQDMCMITLNNTTMSSHSSLKFMAISEQLLYLTIVHHCMVLPISMLILYKLLKATVYNFNIAAIGRWLYCSLSLAEEWKRREAKFSQKWSRDRGLGRIVQFVQCSKNFPHLGVQHVQLFSQPSHPFIPIIMMHVFYICKLFFSLCTNLLVGIWCCDNSINLSYGFYSDKFVFSWSKIKHKTVAELDCN